MVCCYSSSSGSVNKSPSALFVASDGVSLRVYQAVLDARSLLTASTTKQTQVSLHCHGAVQLILRAHGLCRMAIQAVFCSVILARLLYASPARWGFAGA